MIAGREVLHSGADLLDDARGSWRGCTAAHRQAALDHVQIAVTDPRRGVFKSTSPDWIVDAHLFEREGAFCARMTAAFMSISPSSRARARWVSNYWIPYSDAAVPCSTFSIVASGTPRTRARRSRPGAR